MSSKESALLEIPQEVFWSMVQAQMEREGYNFKEMGVNSRLTEWLQRDILNDSRRGIPEKVQIMMEKMVRPFFFYQRQFLEMKRTLTEAECGRTLSESWDEFFKPASSKSFSAQGQSWKITCKEGCAACCHLQVKISKAEGAYLLAYAKEKGIEIDKEKLDYQRRIPNENFWVKERWGKSRCVFLGEDNRCKVYEARPLVCRSHASVQPRELCDYRTYPGGQVAYYMDLSAESFMSAAMAVFPQDKTIPQWLWKLSLV